MRTFIGNLSHYTEKNPEKKFYHHYGNPLITVLITCLHSPYERILENGMIINLTKRLPFLVFQWEAHWSNC